MLVPVLLGRLSRAWALLWGLCATPIFASAGCAGHESRTRFALEALDRAAPAAAVKALNTELEVASENDLPSLAGDNALLVLDRGTILHSLARFKTSARDLSAADKSVDMLDMSRTAVDDLGKVLFSDDTGPYQAPAYEKLMINTLNLMNYLALGDLTGAKVEARRLAIVQKYVRENEKENDLTGLGSFLAGFAFEKSGNADEALLYYDDALKYAQFESLRDPLRALTQGVSRSPGIDALVNGGGPLPPLSETGEGEIVVVVGFGRVPQKVPMRIPIGLALTLVAGDISPHNHAQANALAAKGLVTWVNYPTLGPSRGTYENPSFELDQAFTPLEEALDVEAEVRQLWKKNEGKVILAALTRTITRVIAGEVAEGATRAVAGKDSGPLGLLVGLATSATLAAADTPDTRCWATLPARIAVARLRVPAGAHELRIRARGHVKTQHVDVRPGGWAFVSMLALR